MNTDYREFCKVFGAMSKTLNEASEYLNEFIITVDEKEKVDSRLRNISYVYMSQIIINLSKVLSLSGSDKNGIKKLKTFSTDNTKLKIIELENVNKELIEKIKNNRHRIHAHLATGDYDNYINMGFSKNSIEKMVVSMHKYHTMIKNTDYSNSLIMIRERYKTLESKNSSNEQYTISDMYEDSQKIKDIIKNIQKVLFETNQYIYDSSLAK